MQDNNGGFGCDTIDAYADVSETLDLVTRWCFA